MSCSLTWMFLVFFKNSKLTKTSMFFMHVSVLGDIQTFYQQTWHQRWYHSWWADGWTYMEFWYFCLSCCSWNTYMMFSQATCHLVPFPCPSLETWWLSALMIQWRSSQRCAFVCYCFMSYVDIFQEVDFAFVRLPSDMGTWARCTLETDPVFCSLDMRLSKRLLWNMRMSSRNGRSSP